MPILAYLYEDEINFYDEHPRFHNVCITSESFGLKVSLWSFAICPKLRSLVSCRHPSTSLLLFYTSLNSQFLKFYFYLNHEAAILSNVRSEYDDFMNLLFTTFTTYHFTLQSYVGLLYVVKANFANFLKTVKLSDCVFHCLLDLSNLPTIQDRV